MYFVNIFFHKTIVQYNRNKQHQNDRKVKKKGYITMVKIPRFMKEYASYTKQSISNSNFMKKEIKEKAIAKVNKALQLTEKGLITIDEGMESIMNCFE